MNYHSGIPAFLAVFLSLHCINLDEPLAACTKPANIPSFDAGTYYQSAEGQTGEALKSALNKKIKGHKKHSYKCVWDILGEADQDPNNSNNIILLYTDHSQKKSRRDRGTGDNDAWNREHVWAKSHGFPKKKQHAYTDAHHLRPADKSVNSARGNKDFGEGGQPHRECTQCSSSSKFWGPPKVTRGDVARMIFYMDVRYEGSDQSKTPDLKVVDSTTSGSGPEIGKLCDLYKWHKADPVSQFEKNRNNVVYAWQGNRNPFIDHPEYVKAIWGEQCQDTETEPEEIEANADELIQAIINVLERKRAFTKEEISQEIQRMRN